MWKKTTGTNAKRFGRDAVGIIGDLYRDLAWLFLLGCGVLGTALLLASGGAAGAGEPFQFVDSTAQWGLAEPLRGIKAHAMACGDVDGDSDLDIYIGTFCDSDPREYVGRSGPVPNMLLIHEGSKYALAEHPRPVIDP